MIEIKTFFDPATFTLTYAVWDPSTLDAVVLDPVMDYDPASSTFSEDSVDRVAAFIEQKKLKVHYFLETHAHADHLSGSQLLKARFPKAKIAIGAGIIEVQKLFKDYFDLGSSFQTDGSQFDRLFADGELFQAGSLRFEVLFTPGHTPACASYKIEDAVFTGDTLFMPDYGVGRCDFPGGSAETLFDSISQRLFSLEDATRTLTGHDYQPNGRELLFESTIGQQKTSNVQIKAQTTREAFVKFRSERDKTLAAPKLLLPSVQINIDAGRLPSPHRNGKTYLNIPIARKQ